MLQRSWFGAALKLLVKWNLKVKKSTVRDLFVQDIRHLVVFHQKTGNGLVNLVERKPGRSQKETKGEPWKENYYISKVCGVITSYVVFVPFTFLLLTYLETSFSLYNLVVKNIASLFLMERHFIVLVSSGLYFCSSVGLSFHIKAKFQLYAPPTHLPDFMLLRVSHLIWWVYIG